jgi:hypothetical protein
MGVFMTASEANRLRVVTLLRVENELMSAQFDNAGRECLEVKRGKPSMSEIRQPWTSDRCNDIQSIAS